MTGTAAGTRRTYRTTCKIGACEPFCGLKVDVDDGRLVAVRPDTNHPITQGYACIKGMQVPAYQNDPDRLLHPERRSARGWERIDWRTAIAQIGARLSIVWPRSASICPRRTASST